MTGPALIRLVDAALALDREIKEKTAQLKDLKADLITEALSRKEERIETELGGESWTAAGSDGAIARVTFPAGKLKSSIDPDSKEGAKLIAKLGKHAKALLIPIARFKPVAEFRDLVHQLWSSAADADKVIKAFESDASPTVGFETAEKSP